MKNFLLMTMLILSQHGNAQNDNNVHFSGTLVNTPCTLNLDDQSEFVDFGTIIDKYLYQYKRTNPKAFQIHLEDCDTTIGPSVSVSFTGTTDNELPGFFALDGGGIASGIAVGIETEDGKLIRAGNQSPQIPLQDGETTLHFNAIVAIKPTALINHSLVMGSFQSTVTFMLSYQ
ncbi:type 1 fimbrial protein [Salmonella enterica]|nr:type 1 fimbrial protein [Salmonella enterica]